jgi:hypothetical protein
VALVFVRFLQLGGFGRRSGQQRDVVAVSSQ